MTRDEILREAERVLREADVCEIRLWFLPWWQPGSGELQVTVRMRGTGDERHGATLADALREEP